ncbi:MAG TPA: hypothetical protein VNK41_08185 [Vicinamibacterales bacterium]|nr:hypothetical protein [Vicinamibacterales bacterium]
MDAAQLWKQMSPEKRTKAAEAFWAEKDALEQQIEAMALIARQHNFRLKFVQSLPREKKVRYLATMRGMPEALAGRLLVSYHLAYHRPMLGAFLDALGIPHEDGLITEDPASPLTVEKVNEAAATLRGTFPAEDVDLYFGTLLSQDPETWAALEAIGAPPHTR